MTQFNREQWDALMRAAAHGELHATEAGHDREAQLLRQVQTRMRAVLRDTDAQSETA